MKFYERMGIKSQLLLTLFLAGLLTFSLYGIRTLNFPVNNVVVVSLNGGCDQSHSLSLKHDESLLANAITYCNGGDSWIGKAQISIKTADLQDYRLLTSGYINNKDVLIYLMNGDEKINLLQVTQGEAWSSLEVDTPKNWAGDSYINIVIEDNSSGFTGWGGIALAKKVHTHPYVEFVGCALIVLLIILLPGIVWCSYVSRQCLSELFLPGIGFLSFIGLIYWNIPSKYDEYLTLFIIIFYLSLFFFSIISPRIRIRQLLTKNFCIPIIFFGFIFTQSISIGINPLPVFQEFNAGSSIPSRMIASPPDHAIPFITSVFFYHHKKGLEDQGKYFGDWSIVSRGPIVPLGGVVLLKIFHYEPLDPPNYQASNFPIGVDGAHLLRIYGWILNSLVVIGAYALLKSMGMHLKGITFVLSWLCLSGAVLINTVFLWPKMLAIFFLLLAVSRLISKKYKLGGIFLGCSYLCHPVGILFAGPIIIFNYYFNNLEDFKKRAYSTCLISLWLLITVAPWVIYKAWLGYPDKFYLYPFGDGAGPVVAQSIPTWLLARFNNLWLTFSPGAFFYSGNMHSWIFGPINDSVRWAIQSAKSFPGNIGIIFSLVVYMSAFGGMYNDVRIIRKWRILFWSSTTFILLFWGYSSDGLGRNCLEPLSVFSIIFIGFQLVNSSKRMRLFPFISICLCTLFFENRWIEFVGFVNTINQFNLFINSSGLKYFLLSTFISFIFLISGIWAIQTFKLEEFKK